MRKASILLPVIILVLFAWIGSGCSNADNLNLPEVPNTGNDGPQGDPIDPNTPAPYSQVEFTSILDFAFEKDGDLAISDGASGIHLFDTFGEYKRLISTTPPGVAPYDGMIDVGPGPLDSGRGIIATGTPIPGCGWVSFYDDQYVTGGTLGPAPPAWWFSGEAHPPPECNFVATSGVFGCATAAPRGIDIHPITGWLFMKVDNPKITLDGSDCDLDYDEIPPNRELRASIIAMHPMAPLNGADPDYYEGTYDWIAYHDRSDHLLVNMYGYPMADASIQTFCWDETG
jgi:hypothetical protein